MKPKLYICIEGGALQAVYGEPNLFDVVLIDEDVYKETTDEEREQIDELRKEMEADIETGTITELPY